MGIILEVEGFRPPLATLVRRNRCSEPCFVPALSATDTRAAAASANQETPPGTTLLIAHQRHVDGSCAAHLFAQEEALPRLIESNAFPREIIVAVLESGAVQRPSGRTVLAGIRRDMLEIVLPFCTAEIDDQYVRAATPARRQALKRSAPPLSTGPALCRALEADRFKAVLYHPALTLSFFTDPAGAGHRSRACGQVALCYAAAGPGREGRRRDVQRAPVPIPPAPAACALEWPRPSRLVFSNLEAQRTFPVSLAFRFLAPSSGGVGKDPAAEDRGIRARCHLR